MTAKIKRKGWRKSNFKKPKTKYPETMLEAMIKWWIEHKKEKSKRE